MTYLNLINTSEKILIKNGYTKNIILFLIYAANKDIKDLVTLSDYINDEVPQDVLNFVTSGLDKFLNEEIPLAYITNQTYFLGTQYIVDNHVLPPRSETEDWTSDLIDMLDLYGDLDILDLCCGSGVIGLSIKKQLSRMRVTLADVSVQAVANTKKNAKKHNLDVEIVTSNLFEAIPNKKFDVIVFNPPYVDYEYELPSNVSKWEPYNAIYAPNRGLWYYEAILKEITPHLRKKYLIVMEIGFNLSFQVGELIKKYLDTDFKIIKDSNNIERVIVINRL